MLEVEDLENNKETVTRVVKELKVCNVIHILIIRGFFPPQQQKASKLPEVDISISVRALIITELKSKVRIPRYVKLYFPVLDACLQTQASKNSILFR